MNATIEQVNRYEITIRGVTHKGFERRDEWEGMIKFIGPAGVVIVDNLQNEFGEVFANIFGRKAPPKPAEMRIVKISPELIPAPDDEEPADDGSGD